MDRDEIVKKAESGAGLTVKEILKYRKVEPIKTHTYGKYGTLTKVYLEEHNPAKLWSLAGDLPKYLHGIDKQAEDLYETMYTKLSENERFRKTGDFISDLQKETEIQKLIETEILTELVYVD